MLSFRLVGMGNQGAGGAGELFGRMRCVVKHHSIIFACLSFSCPNILYVHFH